VKRIFRWATEHEFIPPSAYQGLAVVSGLCKRRTEVRETEPIGPGSDDVVEKTVAHLSPMLRAMVELQAHTDMRPGEVIQLRGGDLDGLSPKNWSSRNESLPVA
jgi:hypothetical protein